MITTANLKSQTKADLAKMAKRLGVSGWGAMRKEQLVSAVAKASQATATAKKQRNGLAAASKGRRSAPTAAAKKTPKKTTKKTTSKRASGKPSPAPSPVATAKNGIKKMSKSALAASDASSTAAKAKAVRRTDAAARTKPPAAKSLTKKPVAAQALSKSAVAKKPVSKKSAKKPATSSTDPRVLKKIRELQLQRQSNKDLSFRPMLVRPPGASEPIWEKEPQKDRVALFVRDAYWMHASWDITRHAIERAKAAMLEQWHGAKPVLRLLRMDDTGTTNTSETVQRDIEIHGGSRNWYIEWTGEAASFRVLIGYLSPNGRYHVIAKSNIVKTPGAGTSDAVDEHWSHMGSDSDRIYAMSGGYDGELETGELKEMLEDRLHRSLGAPTLAKLGAGADSPFRRRGGFHFDMGVELVVYGSTVPDGYLTLNGEPVTLRTDGTFVLRVPFPDRRQVLPAVACSRDGSQQRTIVVAVERNTKIMEPLEAEKDTGE